MVSLCYKREKRIESQLSKLITAKPIYSDRVISCPTHLLSSAEFSIKIVFRANVRSRLVLLASAADSYEPQKQKLVMKRPTEGTLNIIKKRTFVKTANIDLVADVEIQTWS